MVLLTCLLGLVVGTAGVVYLVYDGRTAKVVEAAVLQAQEGSRTADAEIATALAAWNAAVEHARTAAEDDGALARAAAEPRADYARIAGRLKATIATARGEVDHEGAAHRADTSMERLRSLEAAASTLAARAALVIKTVGDRARRRSRRASARSRAVASASRAPCSSRRSASPFEDPSRSARARQRLDQVDGYIASFEKARAAFEAAAAGPDTDLAWRLGCTLLATFLDSDLTREVALPVPVTIEPAGAVARVGADGALLTAPALLRYSPFGATDLHLRAPGRSPVRVPLPSYAEIREASRKGEARLRCASRAPSSREPAGPCRPCRPARSRSRTARGSSPPTVIASRACAPSTGP